MSHDLKIFNGELGDDLNKWTSEELIIKKNELIEIIINTAQSLQAIREELSE